MNVQDILQIPVFKSSQIIAGHSGVHREVQHVNMMDAPDIVHYLNPDDLLVTTAYHLKDNPASLMELIKNMSQQGCAGLGIKTQRYLVEIPNEVLVFADEISFPIIEISNDVSLGEIVNQTLSYILEMKTNELTNALKTHQKFTEHIITGKGINNLLDELSVMIEFPLLLLDQYLKPIHSSGALMDSAPILRYIQGSDVNVAQSKTSYLSFSLLTQRQTFSVFPIYTHQNKGGCLIIFGNIPSSKRSVILTIEQATNVISFELIKEIAIKQYEKRARNEFFINFVEGAFSSEAEIKNRAKEFNIHHDRKYICMVGKLDHEGKSISLTQYQMETDSVYEFIEEEICTSLLSGLLFIKGNKCVLLVEVNEMVSGIHTAIHSYLQKIQTKIKSRFHRTISFGVSNISHQLPDIKNAYKDALNALRTGQLSGDSQFIQYYRTKDITEILRIVPTEDLKEFYHTTLQELASTKREEEQVLLQTLAVYLETHCQISHTAKRLFVHRNTVIYRIEKCEDILGISLKDSEATLSLRLALRIKTILGA
jgi:PucR family transcriptional regulator, purine catabolism regulatory protein